MALYDITDAELEDLRGKPLHAAVKWHSWIEEVGAAADYALDGTARSYGANGEPRRPGQGGNWSPSRAHRWWLIDHRAGLA